LTDPPKKILFALIFVFAGVISFYLFQRLNSAEPSLEEDSVVVEFLPCMEHPTIFVMSEGTRVQDVFEYARCKISGTESNILNQEVRKGDKIWIDGSGKIVKGRMDPQKLFALGIRFPLNEADAFLLQELPGIGKELADRIVEKREKSGGFKTYSELLSVKGIGEHKLNLLKKYTCIECP